jgi:hypothetical protein
MEESDEVQMEKETEITLGITTLLSGQEGDAKARNSARYDMESKQLSPQQSIPSHLLCKWSYSDFLNGVRGAQGSSRPLLNQEAFSYYSQHNTDHIKI